MSGLAGDGRLQNISRADVAVFFFLCLKAQNHHNQSVEWNFTFASPNLVVISPTAPERSGVTSRNTNLGLSYNPLFYKSGAIILKMSLCTVH